MLLQAEFRIGMQGKSSILQHEFVFCLLLVLAESSKTGSSSQKLQTLNTVLQQYAFRRVKSAADGLIVDVSVLRLSTDVKLQAAKLVAADFQERGFVFNEFTIPKSVSFNTTGAIVLVYRRFATNVNPYGFIGLRTNLSGPIIGLKAYNLSEDAGEVPVSTTSSHNVIQIKMGASASTVGGGKFTCISFNPDGAIGIEGSIPWSRSCISNHLGDFSFLNPSMPPESDLAGAPSSAAESPSASLSFLTTVRKQKPPWKLGILLGSAVLGALLMAVAVNVGVKALRGMRIARMERKAEWGEALQACLIGRSRAPAAASARTRPGPLEP